MASDGSSPGGRRWGRSRLRSSLSCTRRCRHTDHSQRTGAPHRRPRHPRGHTAGRRWRESRSRSPPRTDGGTTPRGRPRSSRNRHHRRARRPAARARSPPARCTSARSDTFHRAGLRAEAPRGALRRSRRTRSQSRGLPGRVDAFATGCLTLAGRRRGQLPPPRRRPGLFSTPSRRRGALDSLGRRAVAGADGRHRSLTVSAPRRRWSPRSSREERRGATKDAARYRTTRRMAGSPGAGVGRCPCGRSSSLLRFSSSAAAALN
jgi:hypothetical protein